jgi:hypothetical protein
MFHLFFRVCLQVCLSGCCICVTHMLQVFYLDVVYVCNGCKCFRHMFQVSYVFFCMLQVLHPNVSKVDRVLHMGCAWEAGGGMSGPHVGTRNADVGWQCLGSMGSRVDARIKDTETDVRTQASV